MADDDNAIKIEIDGPGVSPLTVDAPLALEIAAALLGFVQRVAADRDVPLKIRGLSIEDKCAAVVAHVDQIVAAREIAREALNYVRGGADPPRGTAEYVARMRSAIRRLPEDQHAAVLLGEWKREITMGPDPLPPGPWARIAHRARLLRIGGQRPMARFESKYDGEFSLSVTAEAARKLGSYLYRPLDIEARVLRDSTGDIERGELLVWHQISDEDPADTMREWFRENAITADEYDKRGRDD